MFSCTQLQKNLLNEVEMARTFSILFDIGFILPKRWGVGEGKVTGCVFFSG